MYDDSGLNLVNSIEIKDKTDGDTIDYYIDQLEPLSDSEKVNLAIVRTIEIKRDTIIINIQNGEDNYCNFSKDNGITYTMSHMPNGLVNWLKEKVL